MVCIDTEMRVLSAPGKRICASIVSARLRLFTQRVQLASFAGRASIEILQEKNRTPCNGFCVVCPSMAVANNNLPQSQPIFSLLTFILSCIFTWTALWIFRGKRRIREASLAMRPQHSAPSSQACYCRTCNGFTTYRH